MTVKFVYDDIGTQWIVRKGDAAHGAILELGRWGFELVVLPYQVLAGVRGVEAVDKVDEAFKLNNKQDVIRALRLNDCVNVLKGKFDDIIASEDSRAAADTSDVPD